MVSLSILGPLLTLIKDDHRRMTPQISAPKMDKNVPPPHPQWPIDRKSLH